MSDTIQLVPELGDGWLLVGRWYHGPAGERFPVISGGGGGSGPRTNGNATTTVQQTGDPSLAELNKYMTDQIKTTMPQYGGLSGLTSPRAWNQMDYGQSTGAEHTALGNLQNFYQGSTTNPYEMAGLGQMEQTTDPTQQLGAANDYMNRIVSPSLINYATASGQGRGGAVNESLANAGASMSLPILQQVMQNKQQFGGTLMNYGQLQRGREESNLQNQLNIAQAPRLDQAQASNSGMDTLLSMLARFPLNSGAGSSTSSSFIPTARGGEPPVWQQVMSGISSFAGLARNLMG